jgi:hypothetical protein
MAQIVIATRQAVSLNRFWAIIIRRDTKGGIEWIEDSRQKKAIVKNLPNLD